MNVEECLNKFKAKVIKDTGLSPDTVSVSIGSTGLYFSIVDIDDGVYVGKTMNEVIANAKESAARRLANKIANARELLAEHGEVA